MRNLYLRGSFLLLLFFILVNLKSKAQTLSWPETEKFGILAGDNVTASNPVLAKGSVGAVNAIDPNVQTTGDFLENGKGNVPEALAVLQDNMNYCAGLSGITIDNSLDGQVLTAGVYFIGSDAFLNGEAPLELQGDSTSVFIININGELTLAAYAAIKINAVLPGNIYWNVNGNIYIEEYVAAYGVFMSTASIYKTGTNFGKAGLFALEQVDISNNAIHGIGHNEYYSLVEMLRGPGNPPAPFIPCVLPGPINYTGLTVAPNLILNGSFETRANCPTGTNTIGAILTDVCFWNSPTIGTPDYFNSCNPNPVDMSVPVNFFGSQSPHNVGGDAYVGIHASGGLTGPSYPNDFAREYVWQELPADRALVQGKRYYGEFYVSLADNYSNAISSLGMAVTNGKPAFNGGTIGVPPKIQYAGSPISDKAGWVRISGTFQPTTSVENHITIGNFNSAAYGHNYYYIDDVALYELPYAGENLAICSNSTSHSITIGSGLNLPSHLAPAYTWTGPNVNVTSNTDVALVVSPTQTSTYTLEVKIHGVTVETSSITISIGPVVTVGPDFTVCANDSKLLTTGQPAGGVWSGTGVTYASGMYSFSSPTNAAGNYTLTYTLNGCSKTLIATVEPATSPIITISAYYPACGRPQAPSASITNPQAGHTYSMDLTDASNNVLFSGLISDPSYFSLPLPGPGIYTLTVTDNQATPPCNSTTINFSTGGVKWLGTTGVVTIIDAALSGGSVNFSGEYLVKGPLELVKGTFNFLPGTFFYVEPQNGVAANTMALHTFAPYLTQNGGATHPTIIKAGDRAVLNISGATFAANWCNSYEKWGGLHLTDGAIINTNEGIDPVTGAILKTIVSNAYVGIGSSQLDASQITSVNNNPYSIRNTIFDGNDYGFWNVARHNAALSSEGIVNSVFSNNGTGVFFEEPNPLVNSFQLGGNHTAGTYTGNTFTNNGTGFKGYMNGLTLASGTFNGNNIGIDLMADGSVNSSVIQDNTLHVGSNLIGIRISLGIKAAWNTITGSTAQQGTGILMGHITEAENNALQSLGVGIEVSTNSYNLVAIQKNTFTDNLAGIRFTPPNPGLTYGGSAPPVIACNTFTAAGIIGSSTVGIYIPQGVRMVASPGVNRLGGDGSPSLGEPSGNYFEYPSIDIPIVNQDLNLANKLYYFRYATSSMELVQNRVDPLTIEVTPAPGTVANQNSCAGSTGPGVYGRMSSATIAGNPSNNPEPSITLGQSYPNPAIREVTIDYQLLKSDKVATLIFREIMSGKTVKMLELKPDEKLVNVSLQGFGNGVYAYTLVINGKPIATKLMLVEN